MSAAQESGGPSSRWPVHMMHTAPVEQRRRPAEPEGRARPAAAPQRAPQPPVPQQPTRRPAASRTPVQRTAVLPPETYRPRSPQAPHAPSATSRQRARASSGALTGPQRRRRWLGGIASALLIGGTLPVQLGAVALESLELLSPGPDGGAMPVVLAAIGVQLVLLLLPMLAGPALGGFTRRWRARLIVLGANAAVVGLLALVGWLRVGQA